MKKDAHYYALLTLALAVGIKKDIAYQIAYSSQFVDDAKINKITFSESNSDDILSELDNPEYIINAATCHNYFKLETFNLEAMLNNTAAFHFVPGCEGESFVKKMRCQKESPIIMDIIDQAKKSDDPIKLGIALHAYADTFSHQGFSGVVSKTNDIINENAQNSLFLALDEFSTIKKNIKNFFMNIAHFFSETKKDKVIPAYGHGQAYDYSDLPYLKWEYHYDQSNDFSKNFRESSIDNRERFKEAFSKIKLILEDFLANNPQYFSTKKSSIIIDRFFELLPARKRLNRRIESFKKLMLRHNLLSEDDTDILNYSEGLWLQQAFADYEPDRFFNRIVKDVNLNSDFLNSNWYQYYQSTKWYKKEFFSSAAAHGLEIPNNY